MYGESNNNLHHVYTYMFPLVFSAPIVNFVNTVITDRIIYHFIKGYTELFVSVKHRKITLQNFFVKNGLLSSLTLARIIQA